MSGGQENVFHEYVNHNPAWRARGPEWHERRHSLFYTSRRRIPGTISKLSLAAMFTSALYGTFSFKRVRGGKDRSKMVEYEYKRKSVAFLQAIEDRKYLANEKRKGWLLEELFEDKEELLALKRLYNDPSIWTGAATRGFYHNGGVQKSYKSRFGHAQDFSLGNDSYRQNIAGTHF